MAIMEKYIKAIKIITEEQSKVVGKDLAHGLAKGVTGIKIEREIITITGDPIDILKNLVDRYSLLFGKASIEVAKGALKKLDVKFDERELPSNLK